MIDITATQEVWEATVDALKKNRETRDLGLIIRRQIRSRDFRPNADGTGTLHGFSAEQAEATKAAMATVTN